MTVEWNGRTMGQLSREERAEVVAEAAAKLQAELESPAFKQALGMVSHGRIAVRWSQNVRWESNPDGWYATATLVLSPVNGTWSLFERGVNARTPAVVFFGEPFGRALERATTYALDKGWAKACPELLSEEEVVARGHAR